MASVPDEPRIGTKLSLATLKTRVLTLEHFENVMHAVAMTFDLGARAFPVREGHRVDSQPDAA
jgi:hypothetical protein